MARNLADVLCLLLLLMASAGYKSLYLSGLNTVHCDAEYETRHIMKIIQIFPVIWIC